MRITDKYILFWGEELSNFYPCEIKYEVSGKILTFPTSEHMFMWLKAKAFGDDEASEKILNAEHPRDARKIGRTVRNFDEKAWESIRYEKMLCAVTLKFYQNERLKDFILSEEFEGKHFVEASPFDRIWGIGYDEYHINADNEEKWNGLNLLGKCLDEVRDSLK